MENKEKVLASISNLKNKNSKIYFLVQDTQGNARASVKLIYDVAITLHNAGFNTVILHEKNNYTGVSSWLDESYMSSLQHSSIESQSLQVAPEDFIVVPEIFGFVMDQIKNIPCGKIVLSQAYRYILETLQPGQSWSQNGFLKCITTSTKQKDYLENVMRQTTYDVLSPYISSVFAPSTLPPMPIVAVHTREQSDAINLIKTFYLKFPQYRWFTFRDMRGLSEKEFAETLKTCFLSVWIDEISSFGTYPLESMSCGVPVLGLIPDIQPEWMTEDNGIWVTDKVSIPDYVADFIQNWLEDNIKTDLYDKGTQTSEQYKNKQLFEETVIKYFENYYKVRVEQLEQQISNL